MSTRWFGRIEPCSDGGVVVGTPVAVSLPGAPCALAVTFRHTINRSETCGNDVYYEPLELTGVALLRRAASEPSRRRTCPCATSRR